MKKYTQEDFDSIQRDAYGYKYLPEGDWTAVDFHSEDKLAFAGDCELGDYCKLGNYCELGNGCELGNRCELGNWCKLGDGCELGNYCELGNCCELGNYCELGNCCELGDYCKLGDCCKLGNCCKLGDYCTMENGRIHNATYFFVSNIGSENRTAYAYCDRDSGEVFIRAGCWFSGIEDFIQRVQDVHQGTQHETDYLAFAAFAKARFAQYQKGD